MTDDIADPHGGQPVATDGASIEAADAAVLLVHGRGATARGMLELAAELPSEGVAYVAPQAARGTWYPHSFLAPIEENEPWLSSALLLVDDVVSSVTDAGVPVDRIVVIGFSQGACLASEFVARNARRYGGLAALSGGLIGPHGTERAYDGSLDGTHIFLGCSDDDPHIPLERVHETSKVFTELDGNVTERIYEGMGHGVNEDELEHVSELVERIAST